MFGTINIVQKFIVLAMMDEHVLAPLFKKELHQKLPEWADDAKRIYKEGVRIPKK